MSDLQKTPEKKLKNGKVFTSKIPKALYPDVLYYFWMKYQNIF